MNATDTITAKPVFNGPLVLCGMHRSGTSLTASLLAAAGLHLGDELLAASSGNERGHFEDLGILSFHRTVLVSNGLLSEGYTTQDTIVIPEGLRAEAAGHVAARGSQERAWGWKEPRTTLFLDFWREMLPAARFVLVFRRPWEVVDSLLRRNESTFHWNPAFAIDVWLHYNQRLLDFAERHPGKTLVCELTQVVAHPESVFDSIRQRFGLPLAEPTVCYEPRLLRQDVTPSHAALLTAACPHAYELYLRLREHAGSDSPLPAFDGTTGSAVDLRQPVFTTWGRATQHMLRCDEAEQRRHQAEEELAIERQRSVPRPWRRLFPRSRNLRKAA